jgi:hypothetical protein
MYLQRDEISELPLSACQNMQQRLGKVEASHSGRKRRNCQLKGS